MPRIALIHALRESLQPIWTAFDEHWPDASTFNLLDDSLSIDRAAAGKLTPEIEQRFLTLGRYARGTAGSDGETKAVLFTCSAFGSAIEAVKRDLDIPVLNPNEAAFEQAINAGSRIGLIVTFLPSLESLSSEMKAMAAARGKTIEVKGLVAEHALAALQAGDGETHDKLIADAATKIGDVDCVVLGQFSMARASAAVSARVRPFVLTTPAAAVTKLKSILN